MSMDADVLIQIVRSREAFVAALVGTFKCYQRGALVKSLIFLCNLISLTFFQGMDGSDVSLEMFGSLEDFSTAFVLAYKHTGAVARDIGDTSATGPRGFLDTGTGAVVDVTVPFVVLSLLFVHMRLTVTVRYISVGIV